MTEYAFWLALFTWIGDRAPPMISGFVGGILGELVLEQIRKRRKGDSDAAKPE